MTTVKSVLTCVLGPSWGESSGRLDILRIRDFMVRDVLMLVSLNRLTERPSVKNIQLYSCETWFAKDLRVLAAMTFSLFYG